jgi:biopolymer transport protein ExbD
MTIHNFLCEYLGMKSVNTVTIFVVVCLFILPTFGQKRSQKTTPVHKNLITKSHEPDDLPKFKKHGYLVTLSLNGDAKVEILSSDTNTKWTLSEISSIVDKNSTPSIIVIKADPHFEFQRLKPWLDAFRGKDEARLKIRFDDNMEIIVPAQMSKNRHPKPNPLFLKIDVEQDGGLNLNGESSGALSDSEPLRLKLQNIFKARADNGVFRLGTTDVDTTVFIKPNAMMTVAAIEQLVRSIRDAGSDRIGLWLDQEAVEFRIQMIQTIQ